MPRLIDADAEAKWANENLPDAHANVITAFLRDCSTIDPVHAAGACYCRECDLWNDWDYAVRESLGNLRCSCAHWSNDDGHMIYTAPTDFCSYGERRDKDAK